MTLLCAIPRYAFLSPPTAANSGNNSPPQDGEGPTHRDPPTQRSFAMCIPCFTFLFTRLHLVLT